MTLEDEYGLAEGDAVALGDRRAVELAGHVRSGEGHDEREPRGPTQVEAA